MPTTLQSPAVFSVTLASDVRLSPGARTHVSSTIDVRGSASDPAHSHSRPAAIARFVMSGTPPCALGPAIACSPQSRGEDIASGYVPVFVSVSVTRWLAPTVHEPV